MLHGRSLFRDITVSDRERCAIRNYRSVLDDDLPKTDRKRKRPPSSLREYLSGRIAKRTKDPAARQNARLFGYYVSAYGRESGNQIGEVSNDLSEDEGRIYGKRVKGDVNIFILIYPCNSRVCKSAPNTNVSARVESFEEESRARACNLLLTSVSRNYSRQISIMDNRDSILATIT